MILNTSMYKLMGSCALPTRTTLIVPKMFELQIDVVLFIVVLSTLYMPHILLDITDTALVGIGSLLAPGWPTTTNV